MAYGSGWDKIPGEIKRREVALDLQVIPEEIVGRWS